MLRTSLTPLKLTREVAGASSRGAALVESRRYRSALETHKHITYSGIGPSKQRVPIVDVELVKPGEPFSSTLMLGDMVKAREFKFDMASLNARGFLRFQKAYSPPANAEGVLLTLCRQCMTDARGDTEEALKQRRLDDSRVKFEVLTKAEKEFQHAVPNSMLHMMETVADLVEFYGTEVKTQTPFEELVRSRDLPPNLHIQKEPLRFHPDTDQKFGGETAFTKSSTIVTGLRAKKKYRGYEAKMTWP